MPRICMLTNLFPPVASGSSTQCSRLARELAGRGHEVVVVTARIGADAAAEEVIDGVHVYRLPALRLPEMSISLNFPWLNATFWPGNLARVRGILERHRIELLHVHNHMFDLALTGAAMRRRLGLPMVLTIHTLIKHANPLFNLLLYPADRVALKTLVVRHADAIVCPDINMDAYVRERFGRDDGVIVPYGISLPPPPPPAEVRAFIERFKLGGKRILLSLGHVHALRNRLDLVRAMPAIRAEVPDAVLLIVGAVSDGRAIRLAQELGLGESVVFTGPQPHSMAPALHELAEIEAVWIEQADNGMNSLGISAMEAMLSARPVLTVANPSTFGAGVLEHGRNVLFVDAGKPERLSALLLDLLKDPARSRAIGEAARRTALQHFAWGEIGDRTLDLYGSVLERRTPSARAAERASAAVAQRAGAD